MPLALRFLLALGFVAVLATGLVGVRVRETSREIIEGDFHARIDSATAGATLALTWEAQLLGDQMNALCKHGTLIDKARVDLTRARGDVARLDAASRLALRHIVPEEASARNLDELALVTGDGFVLGASDLKRNGTRDPELAEVAGRADTAAVHLRPSAAREDPMLEAACKSEGDGVTLGLVGRRRISAILARVGEANGVELGIGDAPGGAVAARDDVVERTIDIANVEGLRVTASVSRRPLETALARLDRGIAIAGGVAVAVAMLLAFGLARSLSRPIAALAKETREVVTGEPRRVEGGGGREIRELASAFNQTIDELTALRKRLATTERIAARREVARQVAHEIKNPLAPIRAAVETLRRLRARDDDAFDEYFEEATQTVLQEVHRITNIVTEFTKFARMPAPDPAPMDLEATARGVVRLHAHPDSSAPEADAELVELVAPDELPEIRADRDQIVQVLTNLIQNGLDAAKEVRDDPRVRVQLQRAEGNRVRIVVRDNGPGVPPEMVPRLFEPYATTKKHGTGLGLSIVQRIVFEHGGEIGYRPASKGGAVFEVTLPIGGPTPLDKPLSDTTGRPHSTRTGSTGV